MYSWVLSNIFKKKIVQGTKIQPDIRSDQGELPKLISSAMATQVAVDHKRPKVRGWWQREGGIISEVVIQHLVQDVFCWSTTRWGRGWGCPPGRRPTLRTIEDPDRRQPKQNNILWSGLWNRFGLGNNLAFRAVKQSIEAEKKSYFYRKIIYMTDIWQNYFDSIW